MWVVLSVDCAGRWPRWTWRPRATSTVTVWWMCLSRSVVLTTSSISRLAMQDATTLLLIERCVILSYPSVSRCDIVKSRPYQLLCFDVCCPWNLKVWLLKLMSHLLSYSACSLCCLKCLDFAAWCSFIISCCMIKFCCHTLWWFVFLALQIARPVKQSIRWNSCC